MRRITYELTGLTAILLVGGVTLQYAPDPTQGWHRLPTEAQCAADLDHAAYPEGTDAYAWCWPGPGEDGVFGCEDMAGEYEHGDYHPCDPAPHQPVDCLGPETESVYARVAGVKRGDPDYALARRWAQACPGWHLTPDE